MYRLLQKHGKKLLAVFSAVLMIAFIMPSNRAGGLRGRNAVVGTIGGQKITARDAAEARMSWEVLTHTHLKNSQAVVAEVMGPAALGQITAHPTLFLLLIKEAEAMGVRVSNDQLQTALTNAVDMESLDDDHAANVRHAVADLMLVNAAFQRASSAVKVSEPMVKHDMATGRQSITVSLVEFTTARYAGKVASPTAQELKSQFEEFADVIKETGDAKSNPFGFGYKYPNRLKLQYIAVPRAEVQKAIVASRTPYQWEVDARKYYQQHQNQFPTTRQATPKPEDALSLGGGVKAPTTRPFEEAKQDAIDRIVLPETEKRMAEILDRINTTLAADYVAYQKWHAAATPPSSGARAAPPVSSLGVPYDSFDYLQKLAAQIQSQFKVLPTVVSLADRYYSQEDLEKLADIGSSTSEVGDFATYLMGRTLAFVAPEHRENSSTLHLLEPSRPLRDESKTVYLARVTDAQAAHQPASLAEIEPAVRADVITAKAYAMARADAEKLHASAKEASLKDAAGGQNVITAGPMLARSGEKISGYAITGAAADRFVEQAFKLVSTATSKPGAKPTLLIELPRDGKAIVAQLAGITPLYNDKTLLMEEARVWLTLHSQFQMMFSQKWFDYASVAARTNYVPDRTVKEESVPYSRPQPAPPIF